MDAPTLEMFHTFRPDNKGAAHLEEPGKGVIINAAPATIQLNMGPTTVAINPSSYLGIEPIVDLDSLRMGPVYGSSQPTGIFFYGK